MAYSEDIKQQTYNLLKAGLPLTEIAAQLNIPRQTIYKWNKTFKESLKKESDQIKQIKEQLSFLSKQKPTEANCRKQAMLTKSLARLEKFEQKKQKNQKPKVHKIIQGAKTRELKKKILDKEYGLYPYQKKFLEDLSRFRLWLKSRQIGATYVCTVDCLVEALSGLDQLIISASEEQALKWGKEIEIHASKLGIALGGSANKITLSNGTTIYIFANNFRTIQGFSGSVWLDEFAWYINPKRIWEAFIPSITSVKAGETKARVTILSTPFEQKGLFHKLYSDENKYYMFSRHVISIYDAVKQGLDADIQLLKDLFDSDSWASMYECQFVDDENSFFPIDLIKSCVDDGLSYKQPNSNQPCWAGYDIGRKKDLSVLSSIQSVKNKYILISQDIFNKATFNNQEQAINDFLMSNPKANINIDMTGIGMNLAENTTNKFPSNANGVYFTATSKEKMVLNLKKMLEEKKLIIPHDPALIADIHSIKRKSGAKRFIYDSDRNSNGHADRFWSLALACKNLDSNSNNLSNKGGALIF